MTSEIQKTAGTQHQNEAHTERHGDTVDAKWCALLNDQLAPMPRRRLRARDVLHQAGLPAGLTLVRDFNSPNDIGFNSDDLVDLAEGNVFRAVSHCDRLDGLTVSGQPKLAFAVDDQWEVTIQPRQTGDTLRAIFNISDDRVLFRDFESPVDEPIDDDEVVRFSDGPVFITRGGPAKAITLIVNARAKEWTARRITFDEVVALAYNPPRTEPNILYTVQYSEGPRANPEGELVKGGVVKVKNRMVFLVTETDLS